MQSLFNYSFRRVFSSSISLSFEKCCPLWRWCISFCCVSLCFSMKNEYSRAFFVSCVCVIVSFESDKQDWDVLHANNIINKMISCDVICIVTHTHTRDQQHAIEKRANWEDRERGRASEQANSDSDHWCFYLPDIVAIVVVVICGGIVGEHGLAALSRRGAEHEWNVCVERRLFTVVVCEIVVVVIVVVARTSRRLTSPWRASAAGRHHDRRSLDVETLEAFDGHLHR